MQAGPHVQALGEQPPHCWCAVSTAGLGTRQPRLDVWGTGGFRAPGGEGVGGGGEEAPLLPHWGQCQPQRGNRGASSLVGLGGAWRVWGPGGIWGA